MKKSCLKYMQVVCPIIPTLISCSMALSLARPDVRSMDAAGLPGVELERLVHPGALGLSLPDPRQHLLLAPRRLPVRPHIHPGHHHLPAAPAVCPRRGHRGESPQVTHEVQTFHFCCLDLLFYFLFLLV